MRKLPLSFYRRADTLQISRELLGKVISTHIDNQLTQGLITEVEAYCGENDKACHAHLSRRSKRTEIMFAAGGVAYVYLCYGIHRLFNIVTNALDEPHAILIRSIEPISGLEQMMLRRQKEKLQRSLTAGPGNFSQSMGIELEHYGVDLTGEQIWLEWREDLPLNQIKQSPRIGIDYAGEDAKLPWRFTIKNSPWLSGL